MTTTIKITELSDIGANLAASTVVPVVDMTGTPTTQKTIVGNIANLILTGSGGDYVAASKATTAGTVTTNAQPNITSVGSLLNLQVTGNVLANSTVRGATVTALYQLNAANLGVNGLSTMARVNITNSANLGTVANVHILGGTSGQVLTTNGSGNLSWSTASGNGGNANTGNITFNGDNIESIHDIVNIVGNNYAQLQSSNTFMWVEDGQAEIDVNGNTWVFNNQGYMEIPNNGFIGAINSSVLAFSSQNNNPIILEVINTANSTAQQWTFGNDGTVIFPTLSVQRGDNPSGTISGQTLLFGDNTKEAIISTPDGTTGNEYSQRLVINPGAGSNYGEGGDIYLWAGRGGNGSGSGGDIKIRGGQGGANTTGGTGGDGGYIRMEAGDAAGTGGPGFIEITGGYSNTVGGLVTVTGGQGNVTGGVAKIYGGYGRATGGNVDIWGGASGNGQINEGRVNIQTGGKTWTYDTSGNLTLPANTFAVNYANGDPVQLGGASQPTANGTFTTLPDFLEFVGGTYLRTGQTSDGVFFDGDAGDPAISYPVRSNFSINGTTKVTVTVDMVVNDNCSDFGLCVFEDGAQPEWAWDPNITRIAAQYNCTTPEINTLTNSVSSGYDIPNNGVYRVRFTYDPNTTPNVKLETLTTGNVVLDEISINGTLNTSNSYYIGFAADQDDTNLRTYIQNLTIDVNGLLYIDSLKLTGGGGANTGNVTFNDVNIIGDGNLYLQPDPANANAYLDIFLSSGPDVHLVASQSANLILGKDNQSNVMTSWDGNVYIQSWDNNTNTQGGVWTFGGDGNLHTPGDIVGPANANLVIYANAGVHEFTFGDDGTFYAPDNVVLGGTSIAIGPGADTLVSDFSNAVMVASSNSDAYIQGIIYNVSDNGSADWVAQGHRSDDNGGWSDMGFTSAGFGDANYSITGQGDGYLFAQSYVNGQAPGGRGGNLVLATGQNGTVNDIIFGTGGFLTGNIFGRISHANNALELTRANASISVTGNVIANNFTSNTNSWTLATGTNTVSISVPLNGTYSIWVRGNIPNGIVTYTATAVITNTNVPVLGEQYGWYYTAGNALVLTSIPNQFVGTQGAISNASPYSGNTANVFTFGITNNSGANAVVNYGYTRLG